MTRPITPSFGLDGKRALVTGASSGIGQACALALGDAGAHVVAAARRVEKLEETVSLIREAGGSAEALAFDQADLTAMEATLDTLPAFDVVLNSAGLARHGPALEANVEDFDAVMAVNLRGAYFLSTWAAKAMMAAGKPGSIIHITSQMGHVGGIDRSVYCASKWGVEGMVKAMAIEWGKAGVRINTIAPTFILTDLTAKVFEDPDKRAWVMDKIKLDRPGRVEDIMGAAVYLASEASAMVTGTSMLVDGGWTAD
ncbi:MAG: SDR family oxidoreductase [Silicimonas sp.]|nr:SDR family oxidoreductase [Silicimonas sp.]